MDPDRFKKKEQGNAVKTAYGNITVKASFTALIIKFLGAHMCVFDLKVIWHTLFRLETAYFCFIRYFRF